MFVVDDISSSSVVAVELEDFKAVDVVFDDDEVDDDDDDENANDP
jgi:hypothetical protein